MNLKSFALLILQTARICEFDLIASLTIPIVRRTVFTLFIKVRLSLSYSRQLLLLCGILVPMKYLRP